MTFADTPAATTTGAGTLDPVPTAQANLLWARALVEGLVAGGVRHVVLSPGSRSSPLAFAVHADPRLDIAMQIDERSAAFLALGIAKASRSPVALVCTSGTAAANYLPAMAEASLAGVPLVALTADRPPELRGRGASQTIDQIGLYGSHARHFRDLPCPGDAGADSVIAARTGREACLSAMAGAMGPVHLNAPFREPLVPRPEDMPECEAQWSALAPLVRAATPAAPAAGVAMPAPSVLAALAARIVKARRPLLVAGPGAVTAADAFSVLDLARAVSMPVFADIAAGLRSATVPEGMTLCAHADLFLRDKALAALAPDLVLRLGGIPTSKTLASWLARHCPPLVAIQPDERCRDPDGIVGEVIVGPAAAVCRELVSQLEEREIDSRLRGNDDRDSRPCGNDGDDWASLFRIAEAGARSLLGEVPREAAAVVAACAALPPGAAVFLSSSMPIRWAEMYVTKLASGTGVFVNRGANGIDGIVSTAIGVARGTAAPTLLVTGDLAFLHDAGGLRAARSLRTPLAILLLDNDGGGIFSYLPVARHVELFEPLFGTPQGCDLAAVSRASGIEHRVARSLEEVSALAAETFARGGVRVIQWRTDRAQTVREQAALTRLPGVHADRVEAGGLSWQVRRRGPRAGLPLLMLHGFTGTGEFWLPVANALPRLHCIFPDLPGHGGTDAPLPREAWRLEQGADALVALLDTLGVERFALAGYSMGGRLALALALRHPQRVAALALIGASPGIASADERERRAASDTELAAMVEREGIEAFTRHWEANPLFATQAGLGPQLREAMHAQRLAQDPARLAAALRAFGTGFQPAVHDELGHLAMPVLLMAGGKDAKFTGIAGEMAARIPGAVVRIVPDAGHAIPLERAQSCASELDAFLETGSDPFSGGLRRNQKGILYL